MIWVYSWDFAKTFFTLSVLCYWPDLMDRHPICSFQVLLTHMADLSGCFRIDSKRLAISLLWGHYHQRCLFFLRWSLATCNFTPIINYSTSAILTGRFWITDCRVPIMIILLSCLFVSILVLLSHLNEILNRSVESRRQFHFIIDIALNVCYHSLPWGCCILFLKRTSWRYRLV